MSRIISFLEIRGSQVVDELLVEHVNNMVKLYSRDSKTSKYGNKLLNELRNGYGDFSYSFDDLVFTAIVFHDIGKAFYPLTGYNSVSFRGHEVFSAIIVDELLTNFIRDKCFSKQLFLPVNYSIALHHHAMSVKNRTGSLEYPLKHALSNREEIVEDILEDYRSFKDTGLVGELYGYLEESINKVFEYSVDDLNQLFNMLLNDFQKIFATGNNALKKLMHLTLTTLTCLDYEAARMVRGGSPTFFGSACIDWVNYYVKE